VEPPPIGDDDVIGLTTAEYYFCEMSERRVGLSMDHTAKVGSALKGSTHTHTLSLSLSMQFRICNVCSGSCICRHHGRSMYPGIASHDR